jgi:hypothetical protein
MFDLLKIGSGRTTVKQSREETAARQRTFAAKKRESVSLTDSSTEQPNKADNGADPDESDGEDVLTTKLPPAIRKAVTDSLAMALNPSAKQAKPKSSSAQARTEIKDRLPLLNDRDLNRAEKDIAEEKARRRGVITLHAVMRPNNNAH